MSKQKLAKLKERVLALNAELSTVYREGLKEYAADLLAKFPKVKGISWTQYTPYFNDGEPCEFGINADYPQILIDVDGEEDWHDMELLDDPAELDRLLALGADKAREIASVTLRDVYAKVGFLPYAGTQGVR